MHWLQLNCSASEGKDLFGVEQCKIDFHSLPPKRKFKFLLLQDMQNHVPQKEQSLISTILHFPDCWNNMAVIRGEGNIVFVGQRVFRFIYDLTVSWDSTTVVDGFTTFLCFSQVCIQKIFQTSNCVWAKPLFKNLKCSKSFKQFLKPSGPLTTSNISKTQNTNPW